jgi:hypothetical protein
MSAVCRLDPMIEVMIFTVALALAWIFELSPPLTLLCVILGIEGPRLVWCLFTQKPAKKPSCNCAAAS